MKGQAQVCLCILLMLAIFMDVKTGRIKNELIVVGFITAIVCYYLGWNATGYFPSILGVIFPIICLFWLFLFHMLGAGDIKLFCVTGAFVGGYGIMLCMAAAFLAGAVLAVWKMIWHKNFQERFLYLFHYIAAMKSKSEIEPYYKSTNSKSCIIHFSIPIFIGVCIYMGVYC